MRSSLESPLGKSTGKLLHALVAVVLLGGSLALGQVTFDPPVSYQTCPSPWSLTVGDFNGDNFPDIAVAGWQDGEVSVHLNDQSGGFGGGASFDVGGSIAGGSVAADLNNDGWDDIATANHDGNNVSVLLNDQNGGFAAAAVYAVGNRCWNVDAGDLDGDGWTDLVTANVLTNDVSVLINNQDGTFAPAASYQAESSPIDVTIADLDGDGSLDVATANYSYYSQCVLFNNGDGTLQTRQKWSAGGGSRGVIAVDLDRDSDRDLITANSLDDTITIRANDGAGQFSARFDIPAGSECYQLAAPDIDLDNDPDLLVVNYVPAGMTLLKNHGNGTLAPPVTFDVDPPGSANDMVAADFDQDGRTDFAVSKLSWDEFTVRLNRTDFPPELAQTPLIRGQQATLSVTGARPNETVHFGFSMQGAAPGGLCLPLFGGMCLDLVAPVTVLGSRTANSAGEAELTLTIPQSAPATDVWTQAAIYRGTGGVDSVKTNYVEDQIL